MTFTAHTIHLTVDRAAKASAWNQDAFWGERGGRIVDSLGHRWGLTRHLRDVAIEAMQEIASAAFGGKGLHS